MSKCRGGRYGKKGDLERNTEKERKRDEEEWKERGYDGVVTDKVKRVTAFRQSRHCVS